MSVSPRVLTEASRSIQKETILELLVLLQVDNGLTVVRRNTKDLHDLLVHPWDSLGIYFSQDCRKEIWPRHDNCLAIVGLDVSSVLANRDCSHYAECQHATTRRLRWPSKVPRTLPPSTSAHLPSPSSPITTSTCRTATAASSK